MGNNCLCVKWCTRVGFHKNVVQRVQGKQGVGLRIAKNCKDVKVQRKQKGRVMGASQMQHERETEAETQIDTQTQRQIDRERKRKRKRTKISLQLFQLLNTKPELRNNRITKHNKYSRVQCLGSHKEMLRIQRLKLMKMIKSETRH